MIKSSRQLYYHKNNSLEEKADFVIPVVLSIILHCIIAYLFFFGSPSLFKPLPEEQIIITEVLTVANKTNIKSKTKIDQQTKEEPTSSEKDVAKSKEENTDNQKEKEIEKEKIDDKREKEIISQKKNEDKKKEEKKPEEKPEKKIIPKEKLKPKEDKKKNQKPKEDDDFESLLQNLEKSAKADPSKKKGKESTDIEKTKKARGDFNPEQPLSITEQHAIKAQIERFWNVPIGVKNAGSIKITLYIGLKLDGTVEKIALIDKKCPMDHNRECQAAIDSAIRAVNMASPLEGLDPMRYNNWKEFNFEFDPSEIAN